MVLKLINTGINELTSSELLQSLIAKGEEIQVFLNDKIGPLSKNQLNWKPDFRQWSVAECLDHLNINNRLYFPIIERALMSVGPKPEFKEDEEAFQYTLTGNMMVKMVRPESKKKVQAPKQFLPTKQMYDTYIVQEFMEQHNTIMRLMQQSFGLNLNKIKVFSPVNRVFKFNCGDCYAMIIAHDDRHFQQLQRIMQYSEFPTD
ncbi:MAG: DinB family protein [Ignavibacteriales bacterium]|nr:DinB family protein [Ignavibacteriales bacterium]